MDHQIPGGDIRTEHLAGSCSQIRGGKPVGGSTTVLGIVQPIADAALGIRREVSGVESELTGGLPTQRLPCGCTSPISHLLDEEIPGSDICTEHLAGSGLQVRG